MSSLPQNTPPGIDYDLEACLRYNPQWFKVEDIVCVHAVWEGENDGDHWQWILEVTPLPESFSKTNYILLFTGECDYTGWDCRSSAEIVRTNGSISSILDSLKHEIMVAQSLIQQCEEGKSQTWREKMDNEFKAESDSD